MPAIRADKAQIQQIVIDLTRNAAESYDDQAGVVHISTGHQILQEQDLQQCMESDQAMPGAHIYLQVKDTGCGIPKAMQEKIFEPFVTTKFMGRGLGLSAVRGIVRSLHGAISLVSEKGKGTIITVFFPVDETEA